MMYSMAIPEPWITTSPTVLGGKPCVRGTRISVEHILELLASGASRDDVLNAYPQLTRDGYEAALAYAAGVLQRERVWEVTVGHEAE